MGIYSDLSVELMNEYYKNTKKAAEALLEDTNQVVPVKTGRLRDSGHIEETSNGVAVVYDTDYALIVHETPDKPGYKFLERTLDQNITKYTSIIGGEKE